MSDPILATAAPPPATHPAASARTGPLPRWPRHRRHRLLLAWWLALLAALALFGLWPELDLQISLAARKAGGAAAIDYAWGRHPLVLGVYESVPWLGRAALLLSLGLLLVPARRLAASPAGRRWRARAPLLLAVLVLGLWLGVNEGFKEHWGRPRPGQVEGLGGSAPFRSILQPSTLCASNCSFTSGHAATGFVLLACGLRAAADRRRRWARAACVAGLLIGAGRVLQGGHFASDVLFSGLLIWGVALAVQQVAARWRARGWGGWRGRPGAARGVRHKPVTHSL